MTEIKPTSKPQLSDFLNPAVRQCVNTYLLARTYAKVKREQVDVIQRAVLAEPEHCLQFTLCRKAQEGPPPRITDPRLVYGCEDDAACRRYFAECSRRERAAKIKPADMPEEHCPALCAEHLLVQAENCLIDASGAFAGLTADMLYAEKRDKWLDLVCRIVVNAPGFTGPQLLCKS